MNEHEQVIARIMQMVQAKPETAEWLRTACKHRSWINETSNPAVEEYHEANERLEFLGDSVLGLIIAKALYQRLPQEDEGRLSRAKARLVSAATLSKIAKTVNLGSALLLGCGEEASGGRQRMSLLADILEAVIGAVFLSEGFSKADMFVLTLWQAELDLEIEGIGVEDYKTHLQEYLQKQSGILPHYAMENTSGPDHNRQYEISVSINGIEYGRGWGSSKKQAAQKAAAQAYQALEKERSLGEDK